VDQGVVSNRRKLPSELDTDAAALRLVAAAEPCIVSDIEAR
jgi:hypothetical protein